MSSRWVAEYQSCLPRDASPAQATRRPRIRGGPSLRKSPSSDTLFVDIFAKPQCPSSDMFLNNMMHHETLETIDEAVGFAKSKMEKGSLISGVFTLVASAMGAGCLSLPHMFRKSGLCLGLILLACGALLAHISLVVLMSCARYTQCRSFAELVCLSNADSKCSDDELQPGRSHVVDSIIALYGIAAVLIYLMLIGDFLTGILQSPLFGQLCVSRQSIILGSLVIVFPLSVPKSVTALRYISILSTSAIVFMTVVVLLKMPGLAFQDQSFDQALPAEWNDDVSFFAGSFSTTIQSFAIALFSFNSHTNAVPVAIALDQPRAVRIWQVSFLSVLIEFIVYSLIATGGYLSFRTSTQQDFIRNYATDDYLMLIVRCVYSVPIVFGVPINLSPAAASVQALARNAGKAVFDHCSSATELCRSEQSCTRQISTGGSETVLSYHVTIVAAVLALCAVLASWCEAIADAIGLFGALFGTLICLVWPHRIYGRVMANLHSRSLRITIHFVLLLGEVFGLAAFATQALEVVRSLG
eukprot:TRINITY_DN60874_c0_g1_i1.p1 TRINITY_DN60874_c0_g1~~TRINITY_DN60874_c0_g1_i1.p1  ORF type:complete len:527 (-),score=65.38 TRINITY_DN60874_c0_g1_i1:61-1641(-)